MNQNTSMHMGTNNPRAQKHVNNSLYEDKSEHGYINKEIYPDNLPGNAQIMYHKYDSSGLKGGKEFLGIDEMLVSDSKFLNSFGDIDWERFVPSGGYVSDTKISGQTIDTGTIIDRYGNQYGKYTSPVGVPYGQRALPYIENLDAYHKYEVLKPIDNVTMGEIAEAFDQVGGGIQYELPANIKQLVKDGYLKEIK